MELQQVLTALRNADAAGDTEAATRLAQIAKGLQSSEMDEESQLQQRLTELRSFKPEPKTTVGGNIKEFGKGLVPGAVGLLETAGTGIAALLPEDTEKAAREKIKEIAGVVKKPFEAEAGYEESIGRKLGEGLGSTLPFFAAAPLGVAGAVGGAGLGIAAGAGEAREAAEAKGATGSERATATLLGAPTGLLDILAPEIKPFKGLITTALVRGGVEGATEAAQKVAQNLIAKGVYDPKQPILSGSGEEGAYGAGVGALASLIVDMTVGRKARGAKPTADRPETAPPAAPTAERPQGELFPTELETAQRELESVMGPQQPAAEEPAPAERTATEAGQMSLFKGESGPSELETAQPDLLGDLLPAREQAAAEKVEEPTPARDTETRDMIDELETADAERMVEEDKSAELRKLMEEDKAKAEKARLKMESDIAELDGQIKAKQTKTTEDKRLALLLPIVESDVQNIPKAFVQTLKREGYSNPNLTEREQKLINRVYDLRLAEEPAAPQDTESDVSAMEALIPEKKTTREPQQLGFPGIGKREVKPEAVAEEAAVEEKAVPTILSAEVLDKTGLPRNSGVYKQLLDMDMADTSQQPTIANIFGRVRENKFLPKSTKSAIESLATQAFAGVATQQELFPTEVKGAKKPAATRDQVARTDKGATGARPEGGKPVVSKPAATERPAGAKPTEKPEPARLGDTGQPVRDTGKREKVEPGALTETKIHPRMAARIDAIEEQEEAQEQAEYAAQRAKMLAEFKAKHDRDVKGAWAEVQRARQAVKNAGPKSNIDFMRATPLIGAIEDVIQRYDRMVNIEADWIQRRELETLEKMTLSDLPDFRKDLADALDFKPETKPKAAKPKAEAPARTKETTQGKGLPTGGDNAYQMAKDNGEVEHAIRTLAADAYLNTEEEYSVKKAQRMIKDLEAGKVPTLKFGKNNANGPGTGGKFAKDFYASLSESEQKQFNKELQSFLYSEIKTKGFLDQYNKSQEIARIDMTDAEISELNKEMGKVATALHPIVVRMVKDNNLQGALRFVADQKLGRASDVASKLADKLQGVESQVVDFKNPPDILKRLFEQYPEGKNASGMYATTKQGKRIVFLDSNTGLDTWSLLHEATHGAVNATLDNSAHPLTKQLTQLFNDVKESLDTAYGATDVKEFASEAFSNPEFQRKLAAINPKGEKITAWQRFVHAVKNYLRSLIGLNTKGLDSALDSADRMIEAIVNGHPGTSNSLETVSLLGKGSEFFEAMGKRAESLPALDEERIARIHEFFTRSVPNSLKNIVRQSLPLNALVEVAQKYIPMAPKLDVLIGERSGAENKRNQKLEPVIDRAASWARNNPGKLDAFNKVIYESTIAQVDPSKPRKEYAGKMDDSGNKLDAAWDALQEDWKAIGADGQSVYNQMRDTYKKMYDDVKNVLDARIDSALDDKATANKVKTEIYQRLFASGHIEPYFPLTRTGKYWMSYNLGNEFYVEAYETSYQRDKASKELRADGATDVQKFSNLNQVNYRKAPATSFVNNILRTLEANKVDANVTEEVMRLFLNTLPETSFAQSFRKRKGTLGFKHDAIGALRMKAFNLSRQLSNMEYGAKLEKLRADMKDYVRSQGSSDEAVAMMDELDARIDYAISPQVPKWSKVATSLGFNMTLGFNVSSAIVNLTQIPLVVMPYLGGKYGYVETTKAMGRAAKYFAASGLNREVEMMVPTDKGEKKVKVRAFPSMDNYDFNAEGAPKHLKILTEVAADRGQLNRSQIYDILDVDESTSALTKINAASGFVFHHGERMNRQVAMIAAYELELERMLGKGKKLDTATEAQQREAADYAVYVTELTNGGTAAAAAPRLAQNALGKVVFMYKRYGASMYYMLFKTARDALKNADPEVRSAAKRQIAGIYASAALMAGVQGIPMFGIAAMMYNLFLKGDDDDDFDTAARKYLGEGIYNGAINAVSGLEISGRIGLSDLLFRDNNTRASDSVLLSLMETMGGPVFGVASRMERGLKLINDGNIERGIEQMLPSAFGNMAKSIRFATEGANTLRGDPINGEVGAWNSFAQFFGFAPAEYTRQLEINSSLKNIERTALETRTKLLRQYYVAYRAGDIAEAQSVVEDIVKYNRKFPTSAITPDTIKKSMEQHNRTTRDMYHGITLNKALRPQLMQNAYEYDAGLFSE